MVRISRLSMDIYRIKEARAAHKTANVHVHTSSYSPEKPLAMNNFHFVAGTSKAFGLNDGSV